MKCNSHLGGTVVQEEFFKMPTGKVCNLVPIKLWRTLHCCVMFLLPPECLPCFSLSESTLCSSDKGNETHYLKGAMGAEGVTLGKELSFLKFGISSWISGFFLNLQPIPQLCVLKEMMDKEWSSPLWSSLNPSWELQSILVIHWSSIPGNLSRYRIHRYQITEPMEEIWLGEGIANQDHR